jgi:hypothetical protein
LDLKVYKEHLVEEDQLALREYGVLMAYLEPMGNLDQ